MEQSHDIQKEVRRYLMLFPVLLVLTFISVGISSLHLGTTITVILILTICVIQGTIATLFFMHLISEKQVVYFLLTMTVFFLSAMALIIYHYYDLPNGGTYVP